jgi:hypothetical protein
MFTSSVRRFLIFPLLFFGMAVPNNGFCNIWKLTQDAIDRNHTTVSFEQVLNHLRLLTRDENIIPLDEPDTWVIAGGYVVLSRHSIRTFKSPGDFATMGMVPEFEFVFDRQKSHELDEHSIASARRSREDLEGIRIALDIVPTHEFFKDAIGDWSYEKFVSELQNALARSLGTLRAEVSLLRPSIELSATTVEEINRNAPQIVISTQFNNDNQDGMVTFCGGNLLKEEFASERQRARFVEAVLTNKHLYSAGLGACITQHCQDKLGARALPWERSSFEENARPVPVSDEVRLDARLDESGGNFNGIAMRNLIQNGIFAKAVVVPFPDMAWVRTQIESGHEMIWIESYAGTIADAVLDYTIKHSSLFD